MGVLGLLVCLGASGGWESASETEAGALVGRDESRARLPQVLRCRWDCTRRHRLARTATSAGEAGSCHPATSDKIPILYELG
jgi:hypothetical protein